MISIVPKKSSAWVSPRHRISKRGLLVPAVLSGLLLFLAPCLGLALAAETPRPAGGRVFVPSFWDPNHQLQKALDLTQSMPLVERALGVLERFAPRSAEATGV